MCLNNATNSSKNTSEKMHCISPLGQLKRECFQLGLALKLTILRRKVWQFLFLSSKSKHIIGICWSQPANATPITVSLIYDSPITSNSAQDRHFLRSLLTFKLNDKLPSSSLPTFYWNKYQEVIILWKYSGGQLVISLCISIQLEENP